MSLWTGHLLMFLRQSNLLSQTPIKHVNNFTIKILYLFQGFMELVGVKSTIITLRCSNHKFLCSLCDKSFNHVFLCSSLLFVIRSTPRCRVPCYNIFLYSSVWFWLILILVAAYLRNGYFFGLHLCFWLVVIVTDASIPMVYFFVFYFNIIFDIF